MVLDPCGADLQQSAYSGQSGIVQRFSVTYTYSSATDIHRTFSWIPGRFKSWEGSALTGATSITPSYGGLVPGGAFLTANAQQARCLGACIDVAYLGKELDRSGYVAVGVVPASTIPGGASSTIDAFTGRLPVKGRIPPTDFSVKWYPSNTDDSYVDPADPSPGGTDTLDLANALVFTSQGLPTGAQLMVTLTCIVEWIPRTAGMVVATTNAISIPDAPSRIVSSLHNIGRWWTTFGHTAETAMKTASSVYTGVEAGMRLAKGVSRMALALA
jgi:hypothetical protein